MREYPTPRRNIPDPNAPPPIEKRFGLMDLMSAVFIAGAAAAIMPAHDRSDRVANFAMFAGLGVASGLWGAAIATSFNINAPLKRFGVHVYAFLAFVSFVMLLFVVLDGGNIFLFFITGAMTVSMLHVERKRGQIEAQRKWAKRADAQFPSKNGAGGSPPGVGEGDTTGPSSN